MITFSCNVTTQLNKNNEIKKVLKLPPKWNQINMDNMKDYQTNSNGTCIVCGVKSNITIIDFDDMDTYTNFINLNQHLSNIKKVKTLKGFHLYFNYTEKLSTKVDTKAHIDIRNNGAFVLAPPTNYTLPNDTSFTYELIDGDIMDYNNELDIYYETYFPNEPVIPKPKKKEKIKELEIDEDYEIYVPPNLNSYLELIDVKYIDNYTSWFNIILALKKLNVSENEIIKFSKKSKKFTEKGFYNAYNTYENNNITLGIGTIKMYAKLSNLTEYNLLHNERSLILDDFSIANKFSELIEGDFIYSNNSLFVFIYNNWKEDYDLRCIKNLLTITMVKYADNYYYSRKVVYENDPEKLKELNTLVSKYKHYCKMTSSINHIIASFQTQNSINQIDDIFDNYPYLFCFKNTAYDLQTKQQITITKEHYITQNTNYDYVEPTIDELDFIHSLFLQIFPNEEIRKSALSIFYSAMTGITAEKFILFNGKGRNGKGVLNSFFTNMLGNQYYLKFNSVVLIKDEKEVNSANPVITQFHKIRYLLCEEFPDSSKLNLTNIKILTGGGGLKARELYGQTKTIQNYSTMVLECNTKPELNGKIEDAIANRLIDIHFQSTFTSDEERLQEENHYRASPDIKQLKTLQKYRCALFIYILTNAQNTIYIPPIVLSRGNEYLDDSDEILIWIKENYEKQKSSFVTIKDLFDNFKKSDIYTSHKKYHILKKFKNYISSCPATQLDVIERKKINGIDYYNILLNWSLKPTTNELD
jgi:phage/plasmid-associated DNA primase